MIVMTALENSNLFQQVTAWGLGICLLFPGWSQDTNASPQVKDALRLEETAQHTVIGVKLASPGDVGELEYLDMISGGEYIEHRTLRFYEREEAGATSIDITKNEEIFSADKKWTAHCDKKEECRISKVSDPSQSFSVSRKGILTPLFWSPDEEFVLFVRRAGWSNLLHCLFEDRYSVMVYDIAQARAGIVTTVCGGFPYAGLTLV